MGRPSKKVKLEPEAQPEPEAQRDPEPQVVLEGGGGEALNDGKAEEVNEEGGKVQQDEGREEDADEDEQQTTVAADDDLLSDEDDGFSVLTSGTAAANQAQKRFLAGTNIWVRPGSSASAVPGTSNTAGPSSMVLPPGISSVTTAAPVGQSFDDEIPGYPSMRELQRPFGKTAFDIRIDELEDHPWRRPGVDISDYFNYGFTEETWRDYCKKQLVVRYTQDRKSREEFLAKRQAELIKHQRKALVPMPSNPPRGGPPHNPGWSMPRGPPPTQMMGPGRGFGPPRPPMYETRGRF